MVNCRSELGFDGQEAQDAYPQPPPEPGVRIHMKNFRRLVHYPVSANRFRSVVVFDQFKAESDTFDAVVEPGPYYLGNVGLIDDDANCYIFSKHRLPHMNVSMHEKPIIATPIVYYKHPEYRLPNTVFFIINITPHRGMGHQESDAPILSNCKDSQST
jgi:hypothetical protein